MRANGRECLSRCRITSHEARTPTALNPDTSAEVHSHRPGKEIDRLTECGYEEVRQQKRREVNLRGNGERKWNNKTEERSTYLRRVE